MNRRILEDGDHVYITADVIVNQTVKAVLIQYQGAEVWIPKSQIEDPTEFARGEADVEMLITKWIAKEKGLKLD